jgi:hypothetical protein
MTTVLRWRWLRKQFEQSKTQVLAPSSVRRGSQAPGNRSLHFPPPDHAGLTPPRVGLRPADAAQSTDATPCVRRRFLAACPGRLGRPPRPARRRCCSPSTCRTRSTMANTGFRQEGLADALEDPAIARILRGEVALSVVQWSGVGRQEVSIPWRRMRPGRGARLRRGARPCPAPSSSDTAVGEAILRARQFGPVADCKRRSSTSRATGPTTRASPGTPPAAPPRRGDRDQRHRHRGGIGVAITNTTARGHHTRRLRDDRPRPYNYPARSGKRSFANWSAGADPNRTATARRRPHEGDVRPFPSASNPLC